MVHGNSIIGLKKGIKPFKALMKLLVKDYLSLCALSLSNCNIQLRNRRDDLTHLVIYKRDPNNDWSSCLETTCLSHH